MPKKENETVYPEYSAIDVSLEIINYTNSLNKKITNLHLQKLLFFVEKESLQRNHRHMIKEAFSAWKLGPVVPVAYTRFSAYAGFDIPNLPQKIRIDPEPKKIIHDVLDYWFDKNPSNDPFFLVQESHKERAWSVPFDLFGHNTEIPKSFMKECYAKT